MARGARVLLTNDDGIESPGLRALERSLSAVPGVELWVVAPDRERSTCSHSMTLSRSLSCEEVGERRFAVDGFPADCVYLAVFGILPARPDVVVSGINRGPNLGSDVVYSGTVAGAREAAIRGVHGLAASLVDGDDFSAAARGVADLASALAARATPPPLIVNVNYPARQVGGPRLAPLGERLYPEVARAEEGQDGEIRYRLGGPQVRDALVPGTDGWLVDRGIASVTLLGIDQTDVGGTRAAAFLAPLVEPFEEVT